MPPPLELLLPTAAVLAPSPLLTVTVESNNGDAELHLHVGGQGYWIAQLLAELGVEVTFCTTFGGETGSVIVALLGEEPFRLNAIPVSSANGGYVHDRRSGTRNEIAAMASGALSRHELDELYGAVLTAALQTDVCVLGGPHGTGVVPPSLYGRLAQDLVANGATVVADLSGNPLSEVISGGASIIKVSHEELLADGRAQDDSSEELHRAIAAVAAASGGAAICSRADEPAIAVDQRDTYEVESPSLQPMETRGAGDSFTAGLAAGVARGLEFPEMLRLAAAAGALNVTRHGLGSGRREQVEALIERVKVRPLDRRL